MRKIISILLCSMFACMSSLQVYAEEVQTDGQTETEAQQIDSDESEDMTSLDSSETIEPEITEIEEPAAETEEEIVEEEADETESADEKINLNTIASISKTDASVDSKDAEVTVENEEVKEQDEESGLSYRAHVQGIGWMSSVSDGETAGISGQSRRLEAVEILLPKELSEKGDVIGQAHVQNKGWMSPVSAGGTIGTIGAALQIESIRFWLSGELADEYDIYYRVHIQNNGWLGWASNGADAGSTGLSLRIEAIQIQLVEKGMVMNTLPVSSTLTGNGLSYEAHVQNLGWMNSTTAPNTAGTTGRSLRMEGLILNLPEELLELGDVAVEAHVQNKGWLNAVGSGELAGTTGAGLRLEAVKIKLTNQLAEKYDIYYRTHVAGSGWLGWTMNGGTAGSVSLSRAIEAIDIDLVPKGANSHTVSTSVVTASSVKKTGASRSGIVSTARYWIGRGIYAYGGNDPRTGTDCAGFVQYVFRQHGISLPRSSYEMVNSGYQIAASQVKPGDLAIWSNHVGIMGGGNTCIQALNPSLGIREMAMGTFTASGYFMGYYRINGVAN